MTKRLNSKHKIDRRLKVNLWGRPKSPFNTRAYGPGQHGQSKSSKPSDFGIQLQAKQKLKAYYGNINERQFRNIYKKASMQRGDTGENLIGLLERRLDAIIYRAKFATTIFSARQLINHGHVKVNGKKVNIASYSVKEEDSIEIRDKSKQLAIIDIALANKKPIFFLKLIFFKPSKLICLIFLFLNLAEVAISISIFSIDCSKLLYTLALFINSFAPTEVAKILSFGKIGFGSINISFLKSKFFIPLAQAPIFSESCGLCRMKEMLFFPIKLINPVIFVVF